MEFLTEEEKTTKKWWLVFLFVSVLLSASVFFGVLGTQKIGELPLPLRLFSLGTSIAFAYIYYALCYRRTKTFLLTLSLISFWLTSFTNVILLLNRSLPLDLFLTLSFLAGVVNYIFTRRLRHLNKALKGYAQYPSESQEASAWIQAAQSKGQLQQLFSEGLKKWPRLKWVLRREKAIKSAAF